MIVQGRVNINDLTLEEKKQHFRKVYNQKSYFQSHFNADYVDFDCLAITKSLRQEIERLLLERKLISQPIQIEKLHEVMSEELKAYNFDDGVNKLSTHFYDTDDQFIKVFYQLIHFIRENIVKEPFWFQATPTIRIHCPNGKNNHHYPRYHTDIGYGHPPEEINFWLPLTDLLTGHGFRKTSVENSKTILDAFDFHFTPFIDKAINDKAFSAYCDSLSHPVATPFGKLLAFDSRCIHTGEPLKQHTRASIDIRILPVTQFEKMNYQYQGSGRRKILFSPGHCYHQQDSDSI